MENITAFIEPFINSDFVDGEEIKETIDYFGKDFKEHCYYFELKYDPDVQNIDIHINNIFIFYQSCEAYKYVTSLTPSHSFKGMFYSKFSSTKIRKLFIDIGYDKEHFKLRKAINKKYHRGDEKYRERCLSDCLFDVIWHDHKLILGLCDSENIGLKQINILIGFVRNGSFVNKLIDFLNDINGKEQK